MPFLLTFANVNNFFEKKKRPIFSTFAFVVLNGLPEEFVTNFDVTKSFPARSEIDNDEFIGNENAQNGG